MTEERTVALPVRAVRSVIVIAAQLALRDVGLDGRYFSAMDPSAELAMRRIGVGEWISTQTAMHHYDALDAMHLTDGQIDAMAVVMSNRVNGAVLRAVAAAVRTAGGVSAPLFATHVTRMWLGKFQGGSLSVEAVGPKDARCTFRGLAALGTSRYFRVGLSRQVAAGLSLFTHKCYVKILPSKQTSDLVLRFAWA